MKKILMGLIVLSSVAFGDGNVADHYGEMSRMMSQYSKERGAVIKYIGDGSDINKLIQAKEYHDDSLKKISKLTTIALHMYGSHNVSKQEYYNASDYFDSGIEFSKTLQRMIDNKR